VRGDAPWSTLGDLINAAKRSPGTITYGTPGVGSDTHVAMELIARQQGIQWIHVPFASATCLRCSVVISMLSLQIGLGASGQLGRLRLLATFGARAYRLLAIRSDID